MSCLKSRFLFDEVAHLSEYDAKNKDMVESGRLSPHYHVFILVYCRFLQQVMGERKPSDL